MLSHGDIGMIYFDRALQFYAPVLAELDTALRFRDLDGNKICVCCHDAEA
jgi:hypothetical protein